MKTTVIVQARMGSTRLPGKVLKEISGKPMLEWVVRRAEKATKVNDLVVATTYVPEDDLIELWCREHGIACFRGAEFDVLERFYHAAKWRGSDRIVRITADCPLIDPKVIDQVIELFETSDADFAANRLPPPWKRTFPIGLDVEVVSFAGLERARKEASQLFEREHVMPWFYATEGRCKVSILDDPRDAGDHRWTVDTAEDLALLQAIFNLLPDPLEAGWEDVLTLIESHPELEMINAGSKAKRVDMVDDRIQEENNPQ